MKILKKSLAIFLAIMVFSSSLGCFAAELNADAVNEHYGQYKNYLLLGDSVASGYRDETTEDDSEFVALYNNTTYCRVPGSYGDILANAIIEDGSMTAFAAPGFRTVEIRYMLEDDFAAECDDPYLFHPAQLYVYEKYGYLPGDERIRQAYKDAVKESDLITLGVGGNDWGAYPGWVVADLMEKENAADEYILMIKNELEKSDVDIGSIESFVEIAHVAGVLPELLKVIPAALSYGLGGFYENWDIMIQDIYDLNPNVTLMVLGMSDNSLKGKYFDYNGVVGDNIETQEQDPAVAETTSKIIDLIMSIGNKPMIDGAKKFGYTYVDTDGTTYVDSHPDDGGHIFIANKIIESLPDVDIYNKFDDVTPGHRNYKEIEYAVKNGIMNGTSETTFSPDDSLTQGQLSVALNAITGNYEVTNSDKVVSKIAFAFAVFTNLPKDCIAEIVKSLILTVEIVFGGFEEISRAQAASYIYQYLNL